MDFQVVMAILFEIPVFFWSTLYIVLIKWSNRNLDLYQIITFQTFSTIGRLVRMQSEAALGGSAFLFRSSKLGSGIKYVRCVPDHFKIVTLPLKLYVPYWVITSVLQLWHRCTSAVTKFAEGHVTIDPQCSSASKRFHKGLLKILWKLSQNMKYFWHL